MSPWTSFTSGNAVQNILFHRGLLWAATSGGVVVWDVEQKIYRKYTTLDGLPSNSTEPMAVGPDDALWLSTASGIGRYDFSNGTWQVFTLTYVLDDNLVQDIALGPEQDAKLRPMDVENSNRLCYCGGGKEQAWR